MKHRNEADRHAQGADGYDMADALRRAGIDPEAEEREHERTAA